MLLVICFWLISLIFYSITDRDCVAHRPLTACLFFDIVIGRSSSTPVSPGLACGARRCTTRSAARPLRDTVSKPIVPDFSAMFPICAASSFVVTCAPSVRLADQHTRTDLGRVFSVRVHLPRAWRAPAVSSLRAAAVPHMVSSIVASTPPPTTSTTSSTSSSSTATPTLSATTSVRACARMVFIRLFEFFAVFFELRRRVIRITGPCARSSGFTSSLRPAPPRRQRRRLALPLHLLRQLRAASTSSTPPFCTCDRRGGLLCWSLRRQRLVVHPPSHVRYWQHRCVFRPGKPGNVSHVGS